MKMHHLLFMGMQAGPRIFKCARNRIGGSGMRCIVRFQSGQLAHVTRDTAAPVPNDVLGNAVQIRFERVVFAKLIALAPRHEQCLLGDIFEIRCRHAEALRVAHGGSYVALRKHAW